MSTPIPTIYGLIRTSTGHQDQSVLVQTDLIREAAGKMPGRWGKFFIDEDTSAVKVPFLARPAVRKMMSTVRPGDCVIAWKIDRIARRMRDICDLIEWVNKVEVRLIVLNLGDQAVDFSTPLGRVIVYVMTIAAEMEAALIAERTREAKQWKIARGLPTNGWAPFGSRIVRDKKGKPVAFAASERTFNHMAEACRRHEAGESLFSIGIDFRDRGLKTENGGQYIYTSKKGDCGADVSRLRRGIEWYKAKLEEMKRGEQDAEAFCGRATGELVASGEAGEFNEKEDG